MSLAWEYILVRLYAMRIRIIIGYVQCVLCMLVTCWLGMARSFRIDQSTLTNLPVNPILGHQHLPRQQAKGNQKCHLQWI